MDEKRIVFRMEGPGENGTRLEFSVFLEKLQHFNTLLKECVKRDGGEDIEFHVVNLRHSSPATVEFVPVERGEQVSESGFSCFEKTMRQIQEGNIGDFSESAINSIKQITKPHPEKIGHTTIGMTIGDREVIVYSSMQNLVEYDRFFEGVDLEDETMIGTVDGKIEQVNIHGSTNTFRIYLAFPGTPYINCQFPKAMIKEVRDALGSFVSVSGECFYKRDKKFPYKIGVKKMEKFPDPEQLPSLMDLHGIAPDATGDKSSEQFVRDLRDEWD